MKVALVVSLAVLLRACGGEQPAADGKSGGIGAGSGGSAIVAESAPPLAVTEAEGLPDPEPPDAQARAEAVVNADFNRNKRTSLQMNITTLAMNRTTRLSGAATNLAAREDKIEDKLARLQAKVTETEVTIQLPGSILFDFDSAKIRPDAERTLTELSEVINAYAGRPVRIDGHTDSIASDEYNQKLSEQRARSVTSWLSSNGVDAGRLQANGVGEAKPVATNDTSEGRQLNRRVEVVIAKK
jgi:outer membrane protein OmpA-like peptidoglycan-associated protein